ncbi:MAG TPA: phospholipase D-like domain-containing protein [Candidatus Saccharimonadales bacterium]|nr:phospholipase D-like domain-containing protein [Candidatus Saccharimonadales bacterium]
MTFTVIDAPSYIDALRTLLPRAHKRIVLTAMVILRGPRTDEVLLPLLAAAKRGVTVHVLLDTYTFSPISRPPYLDVTEFKQAVADTRQFFEELRAAGGTVSIVGAMGLNPYAGRYHAKIAVVDDEVFTFGGVNLRDDCFDNVDYMLRATDAGLADTLEHIAAKNSHGQPVRDLEQQLDPDNTLLFDAGQKHESIIFKRACELTSQAQRVTYISQMAPTGRLAKALRGTKATYYANQPSKTGWSPDTMAQWFDQHTNGLKNHYEGTPYIHAKLILYELKNGKKALLSGSHNFSWRGVAFGTKEIALCSYDEQLWRQLHDVVYTVATAA